MITLENISKSFVTKDIRTTALSNINLSIEEGSFIAITGPSGSGKSTLLNVIGLLDGIDSGHYWFCGRDLLTMNAAELLNFRKCHLGFIFQNFNLINELTVRENVELPLRYQRVPTTERQERVDEILKKLAIDHRAGHFPAQLSGGQQQRVAIARALVSRPKLLLADEPTGNLDSKNARDVMQLLETIHREGTTILMVTHSEEHLPYASHVIEMRDGHMNQPKTYSFPLAAEKTSCL